VKMLYGLLRGEDRSQHIGIEFPVKFRFGDGLQWCELIYTRIVDHDVQSSKGFFSPREQGLYIPGIGYISLDSHSLPTLTGDGIYYPVRPLFTGGIIDYHS